MVRRGPRSPRLVAVGIRHHIWDSQHCESAHRTSNLGVRTTIERNSTMSAIIIAIPLLDDSIEQVDIAGFIRHGDYVTAFRDTPWGTAPCSPSRWSPRICAPSCSMRSPPPSPPTPWPTSPRMARSRADSLASVPARPHGRPALRTGRGVTGRLRRGRALSRPARHRGGRRCRPLG